VRWLNKRAFDQQPAATRLQSWLLGIPICGYKGSRIHPYAIRDRCFRLVPAVEYSNVRVPLISAPSISTRSPTALRQYFVDWHRRYRDACFSYTFILFQHTKSKPPRTYNLPTSPVHKVPARYQTRHQNMLNPSHSRSRSASPPRHLHHPSPLQPTDPRPQLWLPDLAHHASR